MRTGRRGIGDDTAVVAVPALVWVAALAVLVFVLLFALDLVGLGTPLISAVAIGLVAVGASLMFRGGGGRVTWGIVLTFTGIVMFLFRNQFDSISVGQAVNLFLGGAS